MTNVIIEVSKYVLIFLMAVYTYLNFSYFRFHDVWEQNRTCARQNVMMFFIHLIAYAILFLKSKDERVVLFLPLISGCTGCFIATCPGFLSTICVCCSVSALSC